LRDVAVNIVGVGNVLMGDDGVGVAAVEALARRRLPEHVRLHDAGLAVWDVLGRLDPRDELIVLDAVRGDGVPGTVYRLRLDPPAFGLSGPAAAFSLHEISVAPALRLEALSGRDFGNTAVFGVEPDTIAWGAGLSRPVSAALDRLLDAVLEQVQACGHAAAGAPSK
jgi:hydrogenase maturation protease